MSTSQNPSAEAAERGQVELQRLLSRSATDHAFRAKLLTTPREAIAEVYGRDVPSNLDIRFVENTADATFVLPDAIDPAAELSGEELETVAGGSELTVASILGLIAISIELPHVIKTIGDDDKWFS